MALTTTQPRPAIRMRPWVLHLMETDYRLSTLGLSDRVIGLLNYEEIYTVPDLAKILRITPDARLSVEVGDTSILGYRSGKEICEALANAGMPMVGCSEEGER